MKNFANEPPILCSLCGSDSKHGQDWKKGFICQRCWDDLKEVMLEDMQCVSCHEDIERNVIKGENAYAVCSSCKKDIERYQKAYDILMGYWDYLPDEEKPEVHAMLAELGL